jgi:Protein kinase domain/MgtE intracellular N domain
LTDDGQRPAASPTLLNKRFRLVYKLGAGGMGSVWLAEDQLLERSVALKELIPHAGATDLPERRARALQEARAMARVRHQAIVPIHDVFFIDDDPWIVMEYISGRSLHDIIKQQTLDERSIARIGLQVLRGLVAVHRANVVHRDVKPTNILVADDDSIFLVDFGIARIAGDASLTGQSIVGTLDFLAPERFRAGYLVGPPADIWALGVTFYYALEGHYPFWRDSERGWEATMMAILNEAPRAPACHGRLADITLQMLEKDPGRRADTEDVLAVLEDILGAGPVVPPSGLVPAGSVPAGFVPDLASQGFVPGLAAPGLVPPVVRPEPVGRAEPVGWSQPVAGSQPAAGAEAYHEAVKLRRGTGEEARSRGWKRRRAGGPLPVVPVRRAGDGLPSASSASSASSPSSASSRRPGGGGSLPEGGRAEPGRGGNERDPRFNEAREMIKNVGIDTGVAMLLTLTEDEAAHVLADCPAKLCGELLQGIAVVRPHTAAAILRILRSTTAGRAFAYLRAPTGAALISSMQPADGLRILDNTDERTVAAVIEELPVSTSATLLKSMYSRQRAAAVLTHVRPVTAAELLRADSQFAAGVLRYISEPVRKQVSRHLAAGSQQRQR